MICFAHIADERPSSPLVHVFAVQQVCHDGAHVQSLHDLQAWHCICETHRAIAALRYLVSATVYWAPVVALHQLTAIGYKYTELPDRPVILLGGLQA